MVEREDINEDGMVLRSGYKFEDECHQYEFRLLIARDQPYAEAQIEYIMGKVLNVIHEKMPTEKQFKYWNRKRPRRKRK